ncbi:MAG TPA: hypothetical protein VGM10_35030 [Actinocrinis sp.]|jgi:hypothetical protein
MSIDFGTIPESAEVLRRRLVSRSRLVSVGVHISFAAAAIAIFVAIVATNASVDTGNLWAVATVPLWVTALTAHIWRRPHFDHGVEVLFFYRRMRRIAWRASVVLVYAAFALLWIASFWHLESTNDFDAGSFAAAAADSGHYRFFSGLWWWPLAAAAAPVAVEQILVHVFLRSARDAMRRYKAARAWARANRDVISTGRGRSAGFDFERGASGRPMLAAAGHYSPKLPPSGESRVVHPQPTQALGLDELQIKALEGWWANASLSWTGRRLVAKDAHGVETEIPLARDAGPTGAAEIVWYKEREYAGNRPPNLARLLRYSGLLFLDPRGHRVGQMPGLGFGPGAVGDVAKSAGLEYAAYDLRGTTRDPLPPMSTRLFPGRRRATTIRAR